MRDLVDIGRQTLEHDGCVTCGDIAVPVKVVSISGSSAICEDRMGALAEIATDLVEDVRTGDFLLAHAGVAIAKAESTR